MPSSDWGIRPRTIAYRKMPWIRRQRIGTSGPAAIIRAYNPYSWYDTTDFASTSEQTWTNRVGGAQATLGPTSGSEANDPTITVNTGSAAGFLTLDGTNDYVQLPSYDTPTFNGTTGAWTLMVMYSTSSSSLGILWSSEATTDAGAMIIINNTAGTMTGRIGSVGQSTTNFSSGMNSGKHVVGLVVTPGSPSTFKGYANGAGLTGQITISVAPNHTTPRIGTRASAVSFPFNGKIYAALQFQSTLTVTQMDDISTQLLALHP